MNRLDRTRICIMWPLRCARVIALALIVTGAYALQSKPTNTEPNTPESLSNRAQISYSEGKYDEALLLYTQALQISRASGPRDRLTEAAILDGLGQVYYAEAQYEAAERSYQMALDVRESIGDPKLATSLSNLGELYYATGRLENARLFYERAIMLDRKLADQKRVATDLSSPCLNSKTSACENVLVLRLG